MKRKCLIGVAILSLIAQGFGGLIAIVPLPILILLAVTLDKPALRFLGSIKFWILSFFISVLAGLFLGKDPIDWHGISVSVEGIYAGVQMVVRSAVFVMSMALIAHGIKKQSFLNWATRVGLESLPTAVKTAVDLLPWLQESWKKIGKNSRKLSTLTETMTDLLVEVALFVESNSNPPQDHNTSEENLSSSSQDKVTL